ncbi:MAG: hypothetical protein HC933_02205 [Pleurocapsa sp. SU_196_0]|nr:hypothetical protein [Pleurocapsa sp. SU_196_0]
MGADRIGVLRTIVQILERDAALVAWLDHTVAASSVADGARILANGTRIDVTPERWISLDFDIAGLSKVNAVRFWDIVLEVNAGTVFDVATALDYLETIVENYRSNASPAWHKPLNGLNILDAQRIVIDGLQDRISVRVTLRVQWVA